VHIIILGAGAIGSIYGAKLSKHHDVTLVGGAAHVAAIQEHGLEIRGVEPATVRIRATTRVDALPSGSLILLTAKVNTTEAVVAPIVPLLSSDMTIVCVQNGLHAEGLVAALVGDRAVVLRAVTQVGGVLVRPGVVDNTVAGYTLREEHERTPAIAAVLTASGLDGRPTADMKREIWRKVVFNCAINPVTSLLGCDVGGIADPRLNALKRQVTDECLAVARADGVDFEEDFVALIDRIFSGARTVVSMRQDLIRGRGTEIDQMNGAVAALGASYGVPCPVNAALTTMITFAEATRAFVPSDPRGEDAG
jgi:2-dehydropantoate 2-reductase